MFLNSLSTTVEWIEEHPETVGLIKWIVGGIAVIIITFWAYINFGTKYNHEERVKAKTSVYQPLLTSLKKFRNELENNGRLCTDENNSKNNIFMFMYTRTCRSEFCQRFNSVKKEEYDEYTKYASDLTGKVDNAIATVSPHIFGRKKWYNSLAVISRFCSYILQIKNVNSYDGELTEQNNENGVPNHIAACKELINAMDYIQEKIN